jgi:uncharacterized protein (DUF488 family)
MAATQRLYIRGPSLPRMDAAPTVYTIGHSTRTLDAFVGLLGESGIECVVDVRRLPGSRAFPHFNAEPLSAALAAEGIDYWHATVLGGRRRAGEVVDAGADAFWTNASFRRYAAHARSRAFRAALDELQARALEQRCVLMCAEAVWWRCHRRIIADHLLARGCPVLHIMGPGQVDPAALTTGAAIADGEVIYPGQPSLFGE